MYKKDLVDGKRTTSVIGKKVNYGTSGIVDKVIVSEAISTRLPYCQLEKLKHLV